MPTNEEIDKLTNEEIALKIVNLLKLALDRKTVLTVVGSHFCIHCGAGGGTYNCLCQCPGTPLDE